MLPSLVAQPLSEAVMYLMGALMFIPPMVSLLKPRFAIKYAEERQRTRAAAAAAEAATGPVRAAGG